MTMLSDATLRKRLADGTLTVDPIDWDEDVQPCSIDLRLGGGILIRRRPTAGRFTIGYLAANACAAVAAIITGMYRQTPGVVVLAILVIISALVGDAARRAGVLSRGWHQVDITDGYRLKPGQFALGTTRETIYVPDDLCGIIYGRSSIGRGGLQVENAGLVDAGFRGQVTLELFNALDEETLLTPGQPIAQIAFHQLTIPADQPYGSPLLGSRYQGQRGATAPRDRRGDTR